MALEDALGEYPGRGLVHHVNRNGKVGWIYFITGRSEPSRARRIRVDPDALVVEPTTGAADDDLRHYCCARTAGDGLVLGNGDHVDVLAAGIGDLEGTVAAIDPEPDPPIWTPRIAMTLGPASTAISVAGPPDAVERRIVALEDELGQAALLTTYAGERESPSGSAPLTQAEEGRTTAELAEAIWSRLPADLRVVLVHGAEPRLGAPSIISRA